MTKILHITTRSEWETAQTAGEYRAPSLDSEGFIHCSTAAQAVKVANAFYAGQDNLVLLCIKTEKLYAQVKWEDPAHPDPDAPPPSDDGEKFPHIYGAVNLDAVVRVIDFPPGADGTFALPDEFNMNTA